MKLKDFEMIMFKLKKLGYPMEEMTVGDAQEMVDKFCKKQVRA